MSKPYRFRGFWIWPFDGYWDVHAPTAEPCSSSVIAEGMSLAEAKRFIRESAALDFLCGGAAAASLSISQTRTAMTTTSPSPQGAKQ